ncbi:unnamed protein product [Parnassius apollo]|uniref:(apollo) hypothetical protein n=1 Tax=Parnassius apollo TaxID=110799 RepID=A0A8S3WTC1_PARAO|nr:unnamed protein product [Parnassius apollo]
MPPKSRFWEFFDKISNGEAKCTCSKVLKTCGNTTNLKLYIEKMHESLLGKQKSKDSTENIVVAKKSRKDVLIQKPTVQTSCSSVGLASSSTALDLEIYSRETDCSTLNVSDNSINTQSGFKKSYQPTLNDSFRNVIEFAENGAKGIRLTNALLYMICKDSQPFQIVENEGFLNLMKIAAPLYKLPSRHTLKRMLDDRYEVTKNLFKDKIKGLNSITLTTDI